MSFQSRMAEKRNELLEELVQLVRQALIDNDVAPTLATVAASHAADQLAERWGGNMIYFPQDFQRKLAKTELEIIDAFVGDNYLELARLHGMTESGMRRLIKRVRAKLASFRHEHQLDMLEPPPDRSK